ncbi:MAG: hypothetical protein M0R66_00305 [Candidatus Omnitrophica bacterium]|jgi:hypothetical protein|nr:hypothetical protein [Candidatus Omnitrophota bacterium]
MDELEEYHRLALLVSNFVPAGTARPMHIVNHTRMKLGTLAALFEPLDDETRGFAPIARAVGAAAGDRAKTAPADEARVIVV